MTARGGSFRLFMVSAAALVWAMQPAEAGRKTVVLLDASNSMNSAFEGGRRIDAAGEALAATLPRYDEVLDLGLVTFGNRQRQSCRDVETLVQPAPGNSGNVAAAARNVRAQGVSMLAQSLQRAAADADYLNEPASIVAVVDGAGVDACLVDTCETAAELKKEAAGLTVHVVAVSPRNEEVPFLQCVAAETGGTYLAANDGRELRNALATALAAAAAGAESGAAVSRSTPVPSRKPRPPVRVADAPAPRPKPDPSAPAAEIANEPGVAAGETANTVSVFAPTGARTAASAATPPARTIPSAPAAEAGNGNGNQMVMAPTGNRESAGPTAPPATAPPAAAGPNTTVLFKRGTAETGAAPASSPAKAPAPAAPAAPGPAATATAPPKAAEDQPVPGLTMITEPPAPSRSAAAPPSEPEPPAERSGTVRLAALVTSGSKPVPSGVQWQVFRSAPGGSRGDLVTRSADAMPRLALPEGDYVVEGRFGYAVRTTPISVSADQDAEASLVLDVGGLKLVPAASGMDTTSADIRNSVFTTRDGDTPVAENVPSGDIIYLSAGQYRIVSRFGGANAVAEDIIQVQPGKLTEARINHRAAPVSFRLLDGEGGPALQDTTWTVTDADGRTIKASAEAGPTLVLAEGTYFVTATQDGRDFTKQVTVVPGQPLEAEIVAR